MRRGEHLPAQAEKKQVQEVQSRQGRVHAAGSRGTLAARKSTLKPTARVAFANNGSGNDTSGVETSGGEASEDEEAGSALPSMVSANTVSLLDEMKLTGGQRHLDLVAKLEESIHNDDARRMYEMGKVVNAPRYDELSDGESW